MQRKVQETIEAMFGMGTNLSGRAEIAAGAVQNGKKYLKESKEAEQLRRSLR